MESDSGERVGAGRGYATPRGTERAIGLVAHLFSLLAPAFGAAGADAAVSLNTACAVFGRTLLGALLPELLRRCCSWAACCSASGVSNLVSLPALIAQAEFARGDVARVVALVFAFTQAVFAFAPAAFGVLRYAADGGWAPVLAAALVQAGAAAAVLAGRSRRGRT